jgi:hypothetical protein
MAYDGTHLWHGIYGADSEWLYKIDFDTGTILDSIPNPGSDCFGLTWDGTHLWVMCAYPEDSIYKIDTLGTILHAFPTNEDYHAGLAWDGAYLWNGRYYPSPEWIYKLDPVTGAKLDTIPPVDDQVWDFAFDGEYLWAVDYWGDTVYQFNPGTGTIKQAFETPQTEPSGATWDGQYLWIIDEGSGGFDMAYQIDVSGGGTPEIELSASSHDYGFVIVDSTEEWVLGVNNVGDADLTVDSLTISVPEFTTSLGFPQTVPPSGTLEVPLGFIPGSLDTFQGTCWVHNDDPTNPSPSVALEGIGMTAGQDIFLPLSFYDYGTIRTGADRRWYLPFQNVGSTALTVDSAVADVPEFYTGSVSFPLVVSSMAESRIPLWFSPDRTGGHAGTLTLYTDDPDESEIQVSLSGYGDPPVVPGGEAIWTYDHVGGYSLHVRAIKSIPDVDSDGIEDVVATSENDTIYCFHGNGSGTADYTWRFTASYVYRDQAVRSISDHDGDSIPDIAIGTAGGYQDYGRSIFLLSGASGDTIWTHPTSDFGNGGWVYGVNEGDDVTGDGLSEIYAGAGDDGNGTGPQGVYCLDGSDGSTVWHEGLNAAAFCAVPFDDITGDGVMDVVCGTGDTDPAVKKAYALDGASGGILWQYPAGVAVWDAADINDINSDDIRDVVVGQMDGKVVALSGKDGDTLWVRSLGSGIVEKVERIPDVNLSGVDDILPAGTISQFYCLEGSTGDVIWSTGITGMNFCMEGMRDITGDGVNDVVGGSGFTYNRVYCMDGTSGDTLWTYPSNGAVESVYWIESLDADKQADVLFGSRDGTSFCISGGRHPGCVLGDANGDSLVDGNDVSYLVDFIFFGGPSPTPCGDANADGRKDFADVVYLAEFLYRGGPGPLRF